MKLQKIIFDKCRGALESDYEIDYLSDIGNTSILPQSHPYYEMYLLVSGEVAYQTSKGFFVLYSGDIMFHDEYTKHCPVVLNPSKLYERIILNIKGEKLRSLSRGGIDFTECFTASTDGFYRFSFHVQNSIRLILGKLLGLKQAQPFGHEMLADAYLTELFVTISEQMRQQKPIGVTDELKPYQILAIVDQFVAENLDCDIRVDDLARFVCMSKYNFMRTFKNLSGKTVYQYIINKRLEAAESLIKGGADFMSAAQMCGFSDYSCFYRSFTNRYKMPPKDYFNSLAKKDGGQKTVNAM